MLPYVNGTLLGFGGPLFSPEGLVGSTEIPAEAPSPGQSGPSEPPAAATDKGQTPPPAGKAKAGKGAKPSAPPTGTGKQAAPTHFHKWVGPDGREHTFADQKALDEFLNKSHMFQADYTRKTQDHTRAMEALQRQRQELETHAKSLKELRERYQSFEKASKTHPDAFKQFADRILAPASADESFSQITSLLDERLSPLEQKLDDLFAEREFNSEQDNVFTRLTEEFPELDRRAVEDFMGNLVNDPLEMTRAMVHALQYRKSLQEGSPEQQQRAAEAAAAARRNGRMLPGGAPPSTEREFGSIKEAHEAARADALAQGEI